MVVSLLAGTAMAGPTGSATDTTRTPAVQSPLVYQQADDTNGTVTFNDSIYDVTRGDTATMNLTLTDLDNITVQVGGGQSDYTLNATVTDGNGDGQVVLLFDTAKAGSGDGTALTTKSDADNLTVTNETTVDGELPANMYGLTVYAGTGENASAIAHGGLNVQADGTTDARTTTTTTTDDGSGDETTTTTDATTTTTESDGQPGFGVAVAVTALAGVTLLARRR